MHWGDSHDHLSPPPHPWERDDHTNIICLRANMFLKSSQRDESERALKVNFEQPNFQLRIEKTNTQSHRDKD